MAETIKIGGELESTATGNVVAAASAIKDKVKNKYQDDINSEVYETLAEHASAISGLDGQNYVTLVATDADEDIAAVFTRLSVTPAVNTIYRIGNWKYDDAETKYNVHYYSEYAANGTTTADLVPITVENKGIDAVPTDGSENLVQSGGVFAAVADLGIFDISAANGGAAYNDLTAALGTNAANIPANKRKPGMSIKFIQSSDNKFVQARLMANSFTTDVTQWQGVDDVPTAGSKNLVESGGVYREIAKLQGVSQYFYDFTNVLPARIKEIYLEGIDTTKQYEVWYCRYYDSQSAYQIIIRAYTQPDKSDAVRAFSDLVTNINGVVKLENYQGYVGNAWVVLTMTENDTSIASGEIDLNVACNLNFSPAIKESFDTANGSVTTAKIADRNVTTSKIADENITRDKLASGSVDSSKLSNGAVASQNIATGAVTEEKTIFFDSGKNLVNPNDPNVEIGYLNMHGNVVSSENYKTTGFIPITPETLYYFTSSDYSMTARGVDFYDINQEHIYPTNEVNVESFTSVANAYWMRVTYSNDNWSHAQVSLLQKYPYEEFGEYTLKKKYIPVEPEVEIVPEVVFPSKVYALKGYENSIYFKNIMEYFNPMYAFDKYGGKWDYYERYMRTDATVSGAISFRQKRVMDLSVVKSISATTNIGDPATDEGNKKVNCIGDSFTYNGMWFDWVNMCCSNLTFVGMRKSYNADNSLRAEGRGGWKLNNYFQPYNDLTPTHMQPFSPFMHVSGYTYYGPVQFWKAVVGTSQYTYGTNGFDDYASWFDSNGYKVNPSNNDLMYDGESDKYVYWNGSSWADFSGTPEFVFDYTKYINTWNISSPDFVLVMLGVNDWNSSYSEEAAATWNSQMNTLIQSVHAYATLASKTITIGICTPTTIIGMPNNSNLQNVELGSRFVFKGRKNIISTFDNETYRNQGVYVIDTGACFDPDYGFVVQEIKPFSYYEGELRELYGVNGVHPSDAGYKQLGTCVAGFIQYIRSL